MRQILCIWLCWETDSLNLKFTDEPFSRIQYRPGHLYRGRPSQKVGAYSCSSLWRPRQLPTRDLRSSNLKQLRDGGISCRILEEELTSIQNCTSYIRDLAITIKICLLSINRDTQSTKEVQKKDKRVGYKITKSAVQL